VDASQAVMDLDGVDDDDDDDDEEEGDDEDEDGDLDEDDLLEEAIQRGGRMGKRECLPACGICRVTGGSGCQPGGGDGARAPADLCNSLAGASMGMVMGSYQMMGRGRP
jgi:hypothetical protein